MSTITIDDTNFPETVGGSEPVLVDFWAEWCGPCKLVGPVLEEISDEYADKLTVAKLDIDSNPQSAQQNDVMSIPTMILFKGGEEQTRIVGAVPKKQIVEQISTYL